MQRRIGEAFQKLCAAQTVADGGGHRQQEDNARGFTIYLGMGDGRWAMGDGRWRSSRGSGTRYAVRLTATAILLDHGGRMSVSRRDFLGAGAAAAAGLALPKLAGASPVITVRDRTEPALARPAGRPVVVS